MKRAWHFLNAPCVRTGPDHLPLDDRRAPSQPRAEDDEQYQVPALNAAGLRCLVQGNSDGGGGGVAVFMHIDEKLFGFGAQPLAEDINDAAIGLVRDDAFDAR